MVVARKIHICSSPWSLHQIRTCQNMRGKDHKWRIMSHSGITSLNAYNRIS